MAIDDIPKEMKRLGFKLISSTEGGKALIAPTLEGLVYYPNKQSKAGVGEFTSIDFDDETQTALIRTIKISRPIMHWLLIMILSIIGRLQMAERARKPLHMKEI